MGEAVLAPEDEQLDSLFEQWLLASDAGPRPSLESFCEEFPDLLSPLRERIDRLERMESQLNRLGKQARGKGDADPITTDFRPYEPLHHPDDTLSGLSVRCPFCRQLLQISPEADLARIECLNCGEHFALAGDSVKSEPAKPQFISQFELIEMVGMGAFGSVWKAQDRELDRTVAVKLSRRGTLTRDDVERVFREARSAAQLRHPNIVSVYEVGQEDETFFIVSEFVEGQSLAQAMKERLLPLREAVALCVTIARALDHAHQRGVVHRDLKPHNIMLDREGAPHLLDFGLAKRDQGELTMTFEGDILGTPAYMSPEQAKGEGHMADRLADVYSLGVILFEMLTGELPFRGDVHSLLSQIVNDDPPSLCRIDRRLPRDLEVISLRCLEKDPGKRYANAAELADDLQRWLDGKPILARPVSTSEKFLRWVRRHPAVSSLTVATLLALVSGLLVSSWQWAKARQALNDKAVAQVNSLLNASPAAVGDILASLSTDDPGVLSQLQAAAAAGDGTDQRESRARLALLGHDPQHVDDAFAALLASDLEESAMLIRVLRPYGERLRGEAVKLVGDAEASPESQLRAAAFVALDDKGRRQVTAEQWQAAAHKIVQEATSDPASYDVLGRLFTPASGELTPAFEDLLFASGPGLPERRVATTFASDYLLKRPANRLAWTLRGEPWQFPLLFEGLGHSRSDALEDELARGLETHPLPGASIDELDHLAQRRANSAIAFFRLGAGGKALPLLREVKDPSARRYFIRRYRQCGADPSDLVEWLRSASEPVILSTLVLTLGQFPLEALGSSGDDALAEVRRASSDPSNLGVREAADWVLRQWNGGRTLAQESKPSHASNWVTSKEGHVMAVVSPQAFASGAIAGDETPDERERPPRQLLLQRRFAIAAKETTVEQYRRYDPSWKSPSPNVGGSHPVESVSWQTAAGYCNWLSRQEGLSEEHWCYVDVEGTLRAADDALDRIGYRLPTEPEWECACRAGSETPRFSGWTTSLLPDYAITPAISPRGLKRPVGSKMPNDWGLYDTYGNADELCHSLWRSLVVMRGGAAGDLTPPSSAIYDLGLAAPADNRGPLATGFRVARTLPPIKE